MSEQTKPREHPRPPNGDQLARLLQANSNFNESLAAVALSPDFDHSLAEVVLRIAQTVNAAIGSLFSYDSSSHTLCQEFWITNDTIHWEVDPQSPLVLHGPFHADITPVFQELFTQHRVFYADLLRLDERTREGFLPGTLEWHREQGRTVVCAIPIRAGNNSLGIIGLAWDQPCVFSSEELDLMLAMSNHAALVMQLRKTERISRSAALHGERETAAQERTRELTRANQALQATTDALAAAQDMDEILPAVLKIIAKTFNAPAAAYFETEGERDMLVRYYLIGDQAVNVSDFVENEIQPHADTSRRTDHGFPLRNPRSGLPEQRRTGTAIIDHGLGTSKTGLDEWACDHKWGMELNIPLVIAGEPFGALALYRDTHLPYSETETELAETLCKQLSLAVQASKLAKESRAKAVAFAVSLEREKATQARAQELTRANGALQATTDALAVAKNMDEMIPAVMRIISQSFDCPSSGYYEFGEDNKIYLRYFRTGDRIVTATELLSGKGNPPFAVDELVKALANGFTINDAYFGVPFRQHTQTKVIDHRLGTTEKAFDDWRRRHNLEMELNIPLSVAGVAFGSLTLSRDADRPYNSAEIELAETLVKQLSLAVQAARLAADSELKAIAVAVAKEQETAAKERADELARANETISASFRRIASHADAASAPSIFLTDIALATSAELCYWFDLDMTTNELHATLRCRNGVVLHEAEESEPAFLSSSFPASLIPNLYRQPQNDDFSVLSVEADTALLWHETADWHKASGRKQVLCFPVSLGDRPMGMLGLAFKSEVDWSMARKELIRALANHLALSIHLCRLSEQARRGAAMEERSRLAREIHDTLAQNFSGILVQLRAMQQSISMKDEAGRKTHFDNTLELANVGLTEARRSLASLRSSDLEGRSLREALTLMARSATKHGGIPVDVVAGADVDFGQENEPELLRIAQESVTNALKHSGASQVKILLRKLEESLDLCIEDNGHGFDINRATEGFGLIGMQERARRVGATMTLKTGDFGTTVCVHFRPGSQRARS